MENKRASILSSALVGLKLLLICALVAGVVAFVYSLTEEPYERNKQATKNVAIGEIFDLTSPTCSLLCEDKTTAVYRVESDAQTVGYCVEVAVAGFGGDMELMVGYDAQGKILGVRVVAHSETPGLGENVKNDSFLSQFEGKGEDLTLGSDLDAIAGATISSRAVTDGVNLATAALQAYLQEGGTAK